MELSSELYAELYSAAPEQFLSVRHELAEHARASGDAELARRITTHRKPTLGAWVVNRFVHAEPDRVEQLVELGARLRAAHEDLDAVTLRELSIERRQLVGDLTIAALDRAGRTDAATGLRDDVTATFDAAVADPQVAARLGRLTRPEHWSGFGVAPAPDAGPPELTVIRGGRARFTSRARPAPATRPPGAAAEPSAEPAGTSVDPAARRRSRRLRDKAAAALADADAAVQSHTDAEQRTAARIREIDAELSRLRSELDAAKHELDRSRREMKSARNRRREARSALDRAERQVGRESR